jgi:CBS domain-containing protein
MESENLQRFKEIIYKESVTLSHLLNKVADEYSALVKNRWSRAPVSCEELMETLRKRAADTLNIRVAAEPLSEKLWVKVDTHSITAALLFVLNQLKQETGTREFICKLEKEKKFVNLNLWWQGSPAGQEMIKKWEDSFLTINGENSPLTLKEVLVHHEAEMWCCGSEKSNDRHICFLLPVAEKFESDTLKDTRILPESRPELDIFSRPGNSEPDSRLLTELSYTVLIREISEITDIEDLIAKPAQLPGLIHNMLSGGATMRNVTWLITTFSDAVLKKLIDLAIQDAGPPPVKFAFIVLGSEGRKEQTLKTDQDNAIIFEDTPGEEKAGAYFSALGEKICTWLDRAGYALCKGEIMAKNSKWCQPLPVWKKYFSDWIHAAEPEDLLHSSIFFDFRFVFGDPELVARLRDHLFNSLTGWSGFFRHMTENTVCFKPPLSFLGNFIVETKGAHRNSLDIKRPMTQIVDFARIYALRHAVRETNTQERLYRLCLKNVLNREAYHETEQAYSYMMQLRFARQIAAVLDENTKPDNYIDPGKLSAIERKMLKEAFKRVEKTQTKLSFDFIGMSDSHMK